MLSSVQQPVTQRNPASRFGRLPLYCWLWGLGLSALLLCVLGLLQQREQAVKAWQTMQHTLQMVNQSRQQRRDFAAELAWVQAQQPLYRPFVALSQPGGTVFSPHSRDNPQLQAVVTSLLVGAFQHLQYSSARPAMHYVIHTAMACRGVDCISDEATGPLPALPPTLEGVKVAVSLSWQVDHEAAVLDWLMPLQARFSGQMQLHSCHWQARTEVQESAASSARLTTHSPMDASGLRAECQLRWVFFPAVAAGGLAR